MTIKLDLDPEAVRDAVSITAERMMTSQIVDSVVIHKNGGATVTFATPEQVLEYVAAELEEERSEAAEVAE